MNLLENLKWRYATKRYNNQVKLADEKVMQIVEAARLAPTSSGLQPVEMILIKNQELKEKLVPIAMNQPQVKECSHLLVFAAWDSYTDQRMDNVFKNMELVREMKSGEMNQYRDGLKAHFGSLTKQQQFEHAARQAYIALGIAIAAAAELKIDSSPMEGFFNDQLDEILGLDKRGLKSVTILALGERDHQNDWLAPMKKVRFDLESVLTII
ncbi:MULTISPECIES: nitroreductase family protein [Myroides]|uniref:NAD(P)H-dependent oxidoreductase n=1 Tax=Myroides albus TaxID=2562892 RepID=A0A6I3LDK4_9FLAO|nr:MULTISPECIES: nitroreductase family protein [Myroides]MTG97599.1 NAD(P)H-dependent oxidoreductase [Myroides albus]MVX35820.1 NAD(P)H-dependent oxidoreductase [Myroides sp. LoEW2-1]UVD79230.1 nitroreductase family protein [Myroides albus]